MTPLVLGPVPAASCHGAHHLTLAPVSGTTSSHPSSPQHTSTLRHVPRVGVWVPPALRWCPEPSGALQPGCDPLPGELRIRSSPNPSLATSFFQCLREEGAMPKPTQQRLQAWEAPAHPAEAPARPTHPLGDGMPTPGSAAGTASSSSMARRHAPHRPAQHPIAQPSTPSPSPAQAAATQAINGIRALQSALLPLMPGTLRD